MAKEQGPKNWASDKQFAVEFSIPYLHEFEELVSARAGREDVWRESYKEWSADQNVTSARNYSGRANLKAPLLRKEVETMSRRLVKGMFPEDYLSATPDKMADFDLAVANTQVVRHYLDNIMNVRMKLMPWTKQGVLLGTSPIRTYWDKRVNEMLYKKRYFEQNPESLEMVPKFKTVKEEVVLYNAPKLQVCDMFQTYIYPVTATDPTEVQRIYYQTKVDYDFLVQKYKAGCCINPEFLWEEGKEDGQEFQQTQERLQGFGESGDVRAMNGNKLYDLLEVWGTAELDGKRIAFVCEVINKTHVIRIQQNPFWNQKPNFHFFRFILPPAPEFYGRGLPENTLSLGAMSDDILNQTMDSASLRLNTITIINPAFAPNADSFEVEPGAIWWADPAGVKQFEFPDLTASGLTNFQALRSIITEMSDNQPQLPEPIAGKARSTGQSELAINEWNTDMYSFVNQNLKEALEPLAGDVHMLLQQNLPDDEVIRISGKYAGSWVNRVVTPGDIVGRYNFKWTGAVAVQDKRVNAQQMLQLFKIYPMLPPGEVKLKLSNIMIKFLRDGLGIQDVENCIETPEFNASIAPYIENKLIQLGSPVKTEDSDDDEAHLRSHAVEMNKEKDPYIRAMFFQHINKHKEQIQKKAQAAQQQQQMMQMQMQMQAQGGPQKPAAPNNPMGNQVQLSESTNAADYQRGLS